MSLPLSFRTRSVASLAIGLAGVAAATAMISADVDELTRRSDAVVRGTVQRAESRWSADGRRILTDVEISVAEALKGSPGKRVIVQQPGGVVGDIGQKVSGQASFQVGEEVVVFLGRHGDQRYQVTGMAQGKFRVERSSDGTAAFAVPEPMSEALLLDPATGQEVQSTHRAVPLDDLRERIRKAAAARREGAPEPGPAKERR
jgi:hypothetical protein